MDPGLIVGIVLGGGALVTIIVVLIAMFTKQSSVQMQRRPLNAAGIPPNITFVCAGPVDVQRLTAVTIEAVKCLKDDTAWDDDAIDNALTGTLININNVDRWDFKGEQVAGFTLPVEHVVTVGPKLESLCHEFAHMVQWGVEGKSDDAHSSWPALGVFTAIDRFTVWLRSSSLTTPLGL